MDYINILGFNIPSYSFFILAGMIIGNIAAYFTMKKKGLIIDDFILIATYSLTLGWIGAKLLFLWVSRDAIDWSRVTDADYFTSLMKGGFVFYGGMISGFIGVILVKIIHKIDVRSYLSKLVYCIPLVHGFGRVGCYFAGCCYGMPYEGPFHVIYHNIPYTICDTKLFPIQLVEAICLFILAFIFYKLVNKNEATINYFYGYIISYSVVRFILEYFRYDAGRGRYGIFSTSQWISVVLFVVLLSRVLYINRRKIVNG